MNKEKLNQTEQSAMAGIYALSFEPSVLIIKGLICEIDILQGRITNMEKIIKELSSKKSDTRNSHACSQHRFRRQKCPLECPNRKRHKY